MNGTLIEGLVGFLGGSLVIIAIMELLNRYNLVSQYYWAIFGLGFVLFYWRREIVGRVVGV